MGKREAAWVSAEEAAGLLGVNRATLYAYVSRGHIRSEPIPGVARQRRYSRDDIERLAAKAAQRRDPETAVSRSLQWGLPVLDSAITLIADGRIYYRGHDAAVLAGQNSIAEVAGLIWTGTLADSVTPAAVDPIRPHRHTAALPFISAAQTELAFAAADDPAASDLRASAVARSGWRILDMLARVAAGSTAAASSIDELLAQSWRVPGAAAALRSALILCADHEFNVSAFTARCVASAGTHPYGVVCAALAALEGFRHGGTTSRVESLWDALRNSRDLKQALASRLRRGELLDGFGHPLYPTGDPRARILLESLPATSESDFAARLAAAVDDVIGESPVLDFGLVALRRTLQLPQGAALMLFAIGRTIGWIGHAIEQYALQSLIRPRARYIGPVPATQ